MLSPDEKHACRYTNERPPAAHKKKLRPPLNFLAASDVRFDTLADAEITAGNSRNLLQFLLLAGLAARTVFEFELRAETVALRPRQCTNHELGCQVSSVNSSKFATDSRGQNATRGCLCIIYERLKKI